MNNDADGFSICPSIDDYDLDIVVYEPKANSTFYTDDTCELMSQLRDILKVSLAQGWDVFTPECVT